MHCNYAIRVRCTVSLLECDSAMILARAGEVCTAMIVPRAVMGDDSCRSSLGVSVGRAGWPWIFGPLCLTGRTCQSLAMTSGFGLFNLFLEGELKFLTLFWFSFPWQYKLGENVTT